YRIMALRLLCRDFDPLDQSFFGTLMKIKAELLDIKSVKTCIGTVLITRTANFRRSLSKSLGQEKEAFLNRRRSATNPPSLHQVTHTGFERTKKATKVVHRRRP